MTDYQKYQLQWMIDHGHSIQELVQELNDYQNESDDMEQTVQDVFNAWEFDRGFGGEIWACEGEYNDCEGRCE